MVCASAQRARPCPRADDLALAAHSALSDVRLDGAQVAARPAPEHGISVRARHEVGVIELGDEAGLVTVVGRSGWLLGWEAAVTPLFADCAGS
jgi:hypothetical protein